MNKEERGWNRFNMNDDFEPDPYIVKLGWWEMDCDDMGVWDITDKQKKQIEEAERNNIRFVTIGNKWVQIAFIKGGIYKIRKYTADDLKEYPLPKKEEKFIIEDRRKELPF